MKGQQERILDLNSMSGKTSYQYSPATDTVDVISELWETPQDRPVTASLRLTVLISSNQWASPPSGRLPMTLTPESAQSSPSSYARWMVNAFSADFDAS